MKNLTKNIFLIGTGLLLSLQSNMATANIVTDVELNSPMLRGSLISAEIFGLLPDTCTTIKSARHELVSHLGANQDLNLFIETEVKDEQCIEASLPFSQKIFIGDLDEGVFTLNIYEGARLVLRREILIPEDVVPTNMDFHYEPNIVGSRMPNR